MAIELGHIALAEAHHFMIALALGVEVRAALAAAHGQAGQRVLERLLEREELQHAFGDGGVETDPALIGADRVVILHPPATLHADLALIVFPAHPERDHTVGFADPAQDLIFVILRLVGNEIENVFGNFLHRLNEFGLAGIVLAHIANERFEVGIFPDAHDGLLKRTLGRSFTDHLLFLLAHPDCPAPLDGKRAINPPFCCIARAF